MRKYYQTDKLKPCPFCGGEARAYDVKFPRAKEEFLKFVIVECPFCEIEMMENNIDDAINQWNRRAYEEEMM